MLTFIRRKIQESLLKTVLETEPFVRVVIDRRGRVLKNRRAESFLKDRLPLDVLRGMLPDDEEAAVSFERLKRAVSGRLSVTEELTLEEAKTLSFYRVSVSFTDDIESWIVEDVSAEKALRLIAHHRSRKFQDFLDFLPAGVYQADAGGKIEFANIQLLEWLGFKKDVLIGKSLSDIIEASSFPEMDGLFQSEAVFKTRKGETFKAFLSQVSQDDFGETILRGVLFKTTSFSEPVESEVDSAPAGFLFDLSPIGMAYVEKSGHLNSFNAAFSALFHLSEGETSDISISPLIHPEDWIVLKGRIEKLLSGEEVSGHVRIRYDRPQTGVGIASVFLQAPPKKKKKKTKSVLLHMVDVSEYQNVQSESLQAQKMQAIGQLAGGIAHDLNNVLTAIIGSSDLLLQSSGPESPSFVDLIQIQQNANRSASLVKQLLAFSRKQPLSLKYIDVTDLFGELVFLLRKLLGGRVELRVEHGRNLGFVRVDQGQFDQVMINLIINARDAMQGGGSLSIRTRFERLVKPQNSIEGEIPLGDYVVIGVTDTGSGIPRENLSRIFEPFFSTKHGLSESGTGMGLATVYGIIRQSEGYIQVDSVEGKGTTFLIFLPRHDPSVVHKELAEKHEIQAVLPKIKEKLENSGPQMSFDFEAAPASASEPPQKDSVAAPPVSTFLSPAGKKTVLLVEDEYAVRTVASRALQAKGYAVVECENAEVALEKIKGGLSFDLLLTDMMMPGMDGKALSIEAKKDRPDIRILIMSGFSEEAAKEGLPDSSSVSFLAKPFNLKDLTEKVKEVFHKGEGE